MKMRFADFRVSRRSIPAMKTQTTRIYAKNCYNDMYFVFSIGIQEGPENWGRKAGAICETISPFLGPAGPSKKQRRIRALMQAATLSRLCM
jgi:hypothetical protein